MRPCLKPLLRLAAALLLAPGSAGAALLCSDPGCSITLDFPDGGSISAPQGATLTFSSGGALNLGNNGSIDPGDGSSTAAVPAGSPAPDMSAGGSIVLGPNGVITFGNGGSLASGDDGQIEVAADTRLTISGAHAANIVAPGSAEVGFINNADDVNLTAQGNVTQTDTSTPVDFVMTDGDSGSSFHLQTGTDLSFKQINNAGSITINSGGSVNLGENSLRDGGGSSGSGSSSSSGGGSSSGACLSTTSAPSDFCNGTSSSGSGGELSTGAGGGMPLPGSGPLVAGSIQVMPQGGGAFAPGLLLAAAGLRRWRRRAQLVAC